MEKRESKEEAVAESIKCVSTVLLEQRDNLTVLLKKSDISTVTVLVDERHFNCF